jgi:hypothetical protein
VIHEAQVPLDSAVYSLRAWAYARAVAPTLNTTSPPPRRAGPPHVPSPGSPHTRRGRQRRTGGRSTAHVATECFSGLEAVSEFPAHGSSVVLNIK